MRSGEALDEIGVGIGEADVEGDFCFPAEAGHARDIEQLAGRAIGLADIEAQLASEPNQSKR